MFRIFRRKPQKIESKRLPDTQESLDLISAKAASYVLSYSPAVAVAPMNMHQLDAEHIEHFCNHEAGISEHRIKPVFHENEESRALAGQLLNAYARISSK